MSALGLIRDRVETATRSAMSAMPPKVEVMDHGGRPPSSEAKTFRAALVAFKAAFTAWQASVPVELWMPNVDHTRRDGDGNALSAGLSYADAFLSGSISDCAEKGFVKYAMHPDFNAAARTSGLSLPVM